MMGNSARSAQTLPTKQPSAKHKSTTQANDESSYLESRELGVDNLNDIDTDLVNQFLLSRCKFNVSELVETYPCRFNQSHKIEIYANITRHQKKKQGKIPADKVSHFTRWKQMNQTNKLNVLNEDAELKDTDDTNTEQTSKDESQQQRKSITVHTYQENVFAYTDNEGTDKGKQSLSESKANDVDDEQAANTRSIAWYLNFAHSMLFVAYSGHLLAQDELQVLEHPFLGSMRECVVKHGVADKLKIGFLSRAHKYSTPCLFTNVPRQCEIDTTPNPQIEGRQRGLYGNSFSRCKDFNVIQSAVTYLSPVTYSNIIAIEAPTGGYGAYSLKDIDYTFYCALTAFTAARIESEILWKRKKEEKIRVVVHTGNWGTGAYGGNKELMSLLQVLAADFAGVDELVYHTFSKLFTDPYLRALKVREKYVDQDGNILYDWNHIRDELVEMKYEWGLSDGN